MSVGKSYSIITPGRHVPDHAAKQVLAEQALCQTNSEHSVLSRLVSDDYWSMNKEVWERKRFPPQLRGREGLLIRWTMEGYRDYFRPPPNPATEDQLNAYVERLSEWRVENEATDLIPANPSQAASLAWLLSRATLSCAVDAATYWHEWDGPDDVDLVKALQTVDALTRLFARIAVKEPEMGNIRLSGRDAHPRFVGRWLSQRIEKECGEPHHALVAAVLSVAFDLGGGIPADTVRKWWKRRQTGHFPPESGGK